jgi:hypothetical protein
VPAWARSLFISCAHKTPGSSNKESMTSQPHELPRGSVISGNSSLHRYRTVRFTPDSVQDRRRSTAVKGRGAKRSSEVNLVVGFPSLCRLLEMRGVSDCSDAAWSVLKRFDSDGDGALSESEFARACIVDEALFRRER